MYTCFLSYSWKDPNPNITQVPLCVIKPILLEYRSCLLEKSVFFFTEHTLLNLLIEGLLVSSILADPKGNESNSRWELINSFSPSCISVKLKHQLHFQITVEVSQESHFLTWGISEYFLKEGLWGSIMDFLQEGTKVCILVSKIQLLKEAIRTWHCTTTAAAVVIFLSTNIWKRTL